MTSTAAGSVRQGLTPTSLSEKHAEQGHQLHPKKLFDLEFPSIASKLTFDSILEPDLSASGSTDNVDNNESTGSSQSRTRSSMNITET